MAPPRDPVLTRLLLAEVERQLEALESASTIEEHRRVLHAIKGSAGVAGEQGLFITLANLERSVQEGRPGALARARTLLTEVAAALRSDAPLPIPTWPDPPEDLTPRPLSTDDPAGYVAATRDRVARIDAALESSAPDDEVLQAAYREVHAMKGAALAVGDGVTSWFCHGLEERLAAARSDESDVRRALDELGRWRGILAELAVAPDEALSTLRARARRSSRPPSELQLPLPPRRPALDSSHESELPRSARDDSVRVSSDLLDRLFERVRQVSQARGVVQGGASESHQAALQARQLHGRLAEALRLIGPPRPWGAPAAAIQRIDETARELAEMAARQERESVSLRSAATRVRAEVSAAQAELAAMRTTRVATLFDRVGAAVRALAARGGLEIRVTTEGGEVPIDRRHVDALVDPVLQLGRNAVAHGLEPAAERVARGKPPVGTLSLRAERRGGSLVVVVEDDGAGVDAVDVRQRAVASGTITREMASALDDETLLGLLFVPGFTTRDTADLIAGRGVGLDLSLAAVRRLGGTIVLASRPGLGLTATIKLPVESSLVRVVWLKAGPRWYAVPLADTRRVLVGRDVPESRVTPLLDCLLAARGRLDAGARRLDPRQRTFALELRDGAPREDPGSVTFVGVEEVGSLEDVAVRAVSPLVSIAGPYAGAIVRGDDIRFCLDTHALIDFVTLARAGGPGGRAPCAP